ncbi:uncharacterized protein LY89DRAFT_691455 [Mollisia scopiformis]|uniref:Uncharacterized protein n=1 Tax=Mollisia scopiformis TaxID=149040 RepID=A0A132B6T9_MOLSC|nr:uncharacterized protein LY89DRAFT_691455 [Mollisia scopiformis]KUJ07719.1 hypothetical protein LY89DRAFT_691455 [Mollisia scopiformis]
MDPTPAANLTWGWVSSGNDRGTSDILWGSLSTIYLCTWTCLCLNFPRLGEEQSWRFLFYKFRWQLFAIFFPEVLVATTAEQWLSAYQSVRIFRGMGYNGWTIRHGFYADMGGIKVAPPDAEPFPVDSHQLSFLVKNNYIPMPQISSDDITAVDKADGFARLITLIQICWFSLQCIGRGIQHIGLSPLELTTIAFILCTLHDYFFWYYKPLDPLRPEILPMEISMKEICEKEEARQTYIFTPLDFVSSPPDAKSLIAPFWFGISVVFDHGKDKEPKPRQTFPNTRILPAEGITWGMMWYCLFFQVVYFGLHLSVGWLLAFPSRVEWYLWTVANFADLGLITVYCIALPLGTYFAPWIGRKIFGVEGATSILEVANMLPYWAKLAVHGPFVVAYIGARAIVLTESLITLRALPAPLYEDVNWADFLPHL